MDDTLKGLFLQIFAHFCENIQIEFFILSNWVYVLVRKFPEVCKINRMVLAH